MPSYPILLITTLLTLSLPAYATDPAPTQAHVQDLLELRREVSAISATIELVLRTDAVETVVQKGTLIARASGQFRFEFTTPSRELHVGDVRTHTIWNPSNNQVIISSVPEDTEKTALHYTRWFEGLGALKDLYTITPAFDSSTAAHAVFTLTPRSTEASSGLLPVTMSIDITTKLPATVTVTDEYTTETIRFSGVKLNPPVDSKTFVFHPPEGADVIDMREEQ